MVIYQTFKTVAYKYKYETAIETESERITYGELLERTSQLYNSFCQLGLDGKTVAVFTNSCPETVYAVLAASRAGARCIILRASGSVSKVRERLSVYRPSVAIVHAHNLSHLAPILDTCGCHCAITVGKAESDILPAVHNLADLMQINDYNVTTPPAAEGEVVLESDGAKWDVAERIKALSVREGVFLSLPLYCGAGFDALWQVLSTGHKCIFCDIPTKSFLKRKKAALCLLYEGEDNYGLDAEYYSMPNTFCINREFLYVEECNELLKTLTGYEVNCDYDGKKVKIILSMPEESDIESAKDSPLSQALKGYCADVFYGIICQKSVVFKKTV